MLAVSEGDTIDFVIGRGADGTAYGSGLRIGANMTKTTNAPPPPPPPGSLFDLAEGFAADSNPNGPWAYGWSTSVGGAFTALTVPHVSGSDGGERVPSWQLTSFQTPAVYRNTSGNTITVGRGAATLPAGTVWYYPGEDGRPENYGVIRLRMPEGSAGNYELKAQVAPVYPGAPQGDTDFYVVHNGKELFSRFLAPEASAHYTTVLAVNEGDTVDFVIGRGADGTAYGSGLRIGANLAKTTNAPPPPPPPGSIFDLAEGFAPDSNPNGPWAYGSSTSVGGAFTALTVPHVSPADGGESVPSWQLSSFQTPAVYRNTSGNTITVGRGAATLPAGTVWYYPGEDGRPENYGVIRLTVPSGSAGNYELKAQVAPVYPGAPQGDTDFHIVHNGRELFSRFLLPQASADYTTVLAISEGDTIDFVIGRGADGAAYGSGLRIAANLVQTTNAPPPPPPPASEFDLADGFSAARNPNGPWAYGWSASIGGAFAALTVPHISNADNGVAVPSWQLTSFQTPAVYRNTSGNTITVGQGTATFPAGTVWYYPGEDGRPENYGVIRLTIPSGSTGHYELRAQVAPVYPGAPQGDTDFHVVHNGKEIFGRFLTPDASANYVTILAVNEGDNIDFVIGRGADGSAYGSGLRIAANLVFTTNSSSMHPPVAKAQVDPLLRLFQSQDEHLILAVDNTHAEATLSGSLSSDPDGDVLDYIWVEQDKPLPSGAGLEVHNVFDLGIHRVTLLVNDGVFTSTDIVEFEVITPAEAVAEIAAHLETLDLTRKNKRPFQATLEAAATAFDRGQLDTGVNLLQTFQKKVQAQLQPTHPELANRLHLAAAQLIDALQ